MYKISLLSFGFEIWRLDLKQIAVSSLDEESKWSVHYTAPWHQQENVFLPGSRPPCVEELHCQAKVNLKTVLRECDKLRKDGFRSSQYYSQGPTFSSPLLSDGDGQLDQDETEKKKKSSETSTEEEKLVYSFRPQTPQLDDISDTNNHSWTKCLPLPTPEEKMKQQAQSVTTDIVPINITGENFDRQASFRRTIINTDTIIRRSKRVKRRKTITGVPDNIKRELDAVFDSGTDNSSPTYSSTGEDIEEMMTPARLRTTDDLFAAIHRSKRKVLGRCDSEEERSRGFITSPPITPTSPNPSMTSTPRQSSNIHRRLRHSTTSNDSFKALLLKKGSRSEPGFRMSAKEMLKCTDPRIQRSNVDGSSPVSAQCTSPDRSRRAYEEWARTEGALPRLSPSLTHSKYGRASTPPCAASSRYNSRSRIPSGPMTMICEREGELTESIDCCNIPFPVSLSSSGTVCAQGST
ncbi:hypothetical protein QTP86_021847 [Hemibagrus guttatus]|nr:hypothetical protein QTP86_021847 [Hemibagrus guttatus]